MQEFLDDFSVYGQKEKHVNQFKKCMTQCRNKFQSKKMCILCQLRSITKTHCL
jgi:hypothetical protein